jgi:DNA polymerase III gamma/tau subunit
MKLIFNPPTVQFRTSLLQSLWPISFLLLMSASACAQPASSSQQPTPGTNKPQQSTEQSSLVEGLLDLLEGPESNRENSKPSIQPLPKQPEIRRNSGSSNPLLGVRDRMKVAADLLQQGRSDQQTVEVQSSIVSQLDELIEQLQQQQKSSQQSSNQQMQQMRQQQMQPSQSPQSSSSKQNESSATKPDEANDAGSETGTTPGDRGESVDAALRRNDPAALQQSVWGHLPDRVRSQMQSRMVEEFLPSYRQHIEAYYRALLEEGGKK